MKLEFKPCVKRESSKNITQIIRKPKSLLKSFWILPPILRVSKTLHNLKSFLKPVGSEKQVFDDNKTNKT